MRDARQDLIDYLDNLTDTDFPQVDKPTFIEKQEETDQSTKQKRTYDALYLYEAADGEIQQHGADYTDIIENKFVTIDVWTPTNPTHAQDIAEDVVDIILDIGVDNFTNTNWERIVPTTTVDLRQESTADSATQYRYQIDVALIRDDTT